MNIIYIGTVVGRNDLCDYPNTSIAANNFQIGLLAGMSHDSDININIISVPAKKSWWFNDANIIQRKQEGTLFDKQKYKILHYINIRFIKELSLKLHLFFEVKKTIKTLTKDQKKDMCFLSYNGDGRLTAPLRYFSKKEKRPYICMVVDPPLYQGTTQRAGWFWNKLYLKTSKDYLKSVEAAKALIVLNESFITLNGITKPYIVVDGGLSLENIESIQRQNDDIVFENDKFNIVFTGVLHEHSGVLRLIEMFSKIKNSDVVLHIYGSGVFENEVIKYAKADKRIIYHGKVPFEVAVKAQQNADLIVCPNPIDHPINKVAFPSKLIEYLASKTPILTTDLPSIGAEYDKCVFRYNDTKEDFEKKLFEIMNLSPEERNVFSNNAYLLAKNSKDWLQQANRVICFLRNDIHG